jgi:alpha-beta hydrolase superfamily lysophospholipase
MLSGADRIIDTDRTRIWFDRCLAPAKHLSVFGESAHTLEFDRNNRPFLKAFVNWLENHSQREGHSEAAL